MPARLSFPKACLLAIGLLLLCAPAASAANYRVDNTGDASGQACVLATPSDCSLRSAIQLANPNDTIDFSTGVFDGTDANSTITIDTTSAVLIQDAGLTIDGACDLGAGLRPCVRLDASGALPLLQVYANGVSISGLAFTGSGASGIAHQSGPYSSLNVSGSWFGVGLDGTTLDANDTGIALINAAGDGIGGSTAAARNVFAANTSAAISIGSGSNHTIRGNRMGVLPDGSPVASPGSRGINFSGSGSGHTIGGDAATAGLCDGECNLIVNYTQDAIRTVDAGGAPTALTIRGNFIGLAPNGTSDQGNGGSGIRIESAHGTNIGGAPATQRNYIAGNDGGGINVFTTNGLTVTNNYVGTSADATAKIANTSAVRGAGMVQFGGTGSTVTDNRFGGNGLRLVTDNGVVRNNAVGVGPAGEDLALTANESGVELEGSSNVIGGQNPGEGNTVGNVQGAGNAALFLTGSAANNLVAGNFIGTTSTGIAAPNASDGVRLGQANPVINNQVGGLLATEANVISNSGGDAIEQLQQGAGNRYQRNVGKNNGSGPNDLFIDIGNDGPTTSALFNDGILPPSGLTITGGSTLEGPAGSAGPGNVILVYATYTSRGDARQVIGQATAFGDGSWNMGIGTPPAGSCFTANQTNPGGSSSELAIPVAVGGGACAIPPFTSIDSGPANGSMLAGTTATYGFSSEAGATFECSIDGGAFQACSSPFTTPSLAPGAHSFRIRAVQSTLDAALSPEVGTVVTRTFIVPTPATAGETGERAAALQKCKKKKSKKARRNCRRRARQLPL